MCLPGKSSQPFGPHEVIEKKIFLFKIVAIFSVKYGKSLINCLFIAYLVSGFVQLAQSLAILWVVDILLYVLRSLCRHMLGPTLSQNLLLPLTILWIVGISLTKFGLTRSRIHTPELRRVKEADQ